MAAVGRVVLWTVVLVAPGGFLLVPVLAASSLGARNGRSFREQLRLLLARGRAGVARVQRYWTKS